MKSKTIVAATDFSEPAGAAVARAALIAREHGAQFILVYAYDDVSWEGLRAASLPAKNLLAKQVVGQAWEKVKAAADELAGEYGINASGVVAMGHAAGAIAATAKASRASLVVLGPHGNRLSDRLFIGSTALGVVRAVTCPVLVVRKKSRAVFRRCLVGADFSPASRRAAAFAAELFPAAAITLLHAVQPVEGPMLLTGALRKAIKALRSKMCEEALERLARAYPAGQAHLGRLPKRKAVAVPASLALLRELRGGRYDLLALGRDAKGAIAERVLGSVPANMLVEAPANVLIVS